MKISTKGRYALRMMLDLAQNSNNSFISLKDIAQRQNISKKYLEQIVPLLNKSGVLRTNRGYQGGYMLASTPDKYTVGDILRITEGNLSVVSCLEKEPNLCSRQNECITLDIWKGLNNVISDYLDNITLQDILNKQQSGNDYSI
jgi:Rrf2 family protein